MTASSTDNNEYQLKCPICNNYETPLRSDFNASIEKLDDITFRYNVANRMLWHLGKEHSKDKDELIKTIVYLLVELKTVRKEYELLSDDLEKRITKLEKEFKIKREEILPRKECKLSAKVLGLD